MSKRKNRNKLIALAISLIALLLLYFLAVKPLMDNAREEGGVDFEVRDGEGIWSKRLTVFPVIETKDIISITVENKNDTFTFHKVWDENSGSYKTKIQGYENLKYDTSVYAYLEAYARIPLSADNSPFRDLSESQMAEYGVTPDTCSAKCTVAFYGANNEKKSHTLYLGYKTFTEEATYYAALEGRNTVYRLQSDADKMFLSLVDYIQPLIYGRFSSSSEAILGIKRFNVFTTKLEQDENGGFKIENLVDIVKNEEESTEVSSTFDMFYKRGGTQETRKTLADSEYLLKIFEALYISFEGDKVIAINPDSEMLEKYGLASGQEQYIVSCVVDNDKSTTVSMLISREIDGYHYVESTLLDNNTPVLVRVPKDTLFFLGTDEKSLLKYASTNSVLTGFYEYLVPNEDAKAPGMKEITVYGNGVWETFYISYNEVSKNVTATTKNSGMVFETTQVSDSEKRNQFSNFYTFLVFYPMPCRFNSMSNEELAQIMTEQNLVYSLEGERRDGEMMRYTYYRVSSSYAVCVSEVGVRSGDTVEWEEKKIVFDTTMEHIEKITDAYADLLAGKELKPSDNIY